MSGGPDPRFVVGTGCKLMRLRYQDTKRAPGWDVLPKGAIQADHQIFPSLTTYFESLGRRTDHLRRPGWPGSNHGKDTT